MDGWLRRTFGKSHESNTGNLREMMTKPHLQVFLMTICPCLASRHTYGKSATGG